MNLLARENERNIRATNLDVILSKKNEKTRYIHDAVNLSERNRRLTKEGKKQNKKRKSTISEENKVIR